jgi:hypothetical protein
LTLKGSFEAVSWQNPREFTNRNCWPQQIAAERKTEPHHALTFPT